METLIPYINNARTHSDEQVAQIAASIKEFGFNNPILCDGDKGIIAGHGRLMAARRLGLSKAPVIELSHLSDIQKKAYILADNRLADNAGWDEELIGIELEALSAEEFDIELTGFSLEEEKKGLTEDDAVPEVEESICVLGDLWILGEHRLLCGDSTDIEQVERLMDGHKADMVFTDPPYGMGLDTDYSQMSHKEDSKKSKGVKDSKEYRPVIGDDKPFDMGLFDWIDCKEQFWWGADYYRETIPKDGAWFVWDKRTEDNFDKMYGNTFELCFSKQVHKRMVLRIRWCGIFGSEQERGSNRVHPTQKPIELCQWFIDKFSQVDGRVFDGFLGSGSTLIACEKTNRKCYGMELDPHYCDVIIKRWEESTGGKAVLNGRA
ncbi:MAG: site-specific DNA-methyltransferase [Desulfobacula sp.]|uniref:site-specific DNA-methyltransferase n=1 Tax=Desulfobacula sp. TaxID=2593537 RepID=UPI001D44A14C|nr:site-specific DNA-methyltransferase [Desulfobacula sp.]MBT7630940.1 site-specific DNA-methyltransferase [Desulfobacula sp.]